MPYYDLVYEHVWMLDRKHLKEGEDDIWAFTVQVTEELEGSKIVNDATKRLNPNFFS